MIKHYVFWGVVTLVLIGMIATLLRDRARRLRIAAAQPRKPDTQAASAAGVLPVADSHAATLPASASARLVALSGALKGRRFAVTAAGITIGRDPDNGIVIADPRVSHHHAWIGIVDDKVVLRDLGSTNGTFINARRDALVTEAALMPGDTIFFGGHGGDQFRFLAD